MNTLVQLKKVYIANLHILKFLGVQREYYQPLILKGFKINNSAECNSQKNNNVTLNGLKLKVVLLIRI
jgi:hypothetical protein